MSMKLCAKCNQDKDLSEFYIKKNGKPHSYCNDCRKLDKKEWDIKNIDHVAEYKEKTKEYRLKQSAEYREQNRERLRDVSVVYNERSREKRRQDRLKPENRVRELERGRKWRRENKERYNKYFHDYYERDIVKKAVRNLRHKLYKILKGTHSPLHTTDIVSCDLASFRKHLESHFTEGMNWSNYGFGADKWNVHHSPPLASYDYSDPNSYKEAFHWSHSFPKWTSENISENSWYNGIKHHYKK
jgi:hypothetical protein